MGADERTHSACEVSLSVRTATACAVLGFAEARGDVPDEHRLPALIRCLNMIAADR